MHLGFSSMNTVHDPRPADLAKILEEAGFEAAGTAFGGEGQIAAFVWIEAPTSLR